MSASGNIEDIGTNAGDPNNSNLRVRRSIQELEKWYKMENGNKKPLEDLIRAFKGIQELEPDDNNSFWKIAGYHGQPFRGRGETDPEYWGGYCNHGNVLFPTWHRAYMLRLENALRSVPDCNEVTLPYWDETDEYTLNNGIPWVLTVKDFHLDGKVIPNPLQSYKFQKPITSNIKNQERFSKPQGYETVRYPQAGLVGTEKNKMRTEEHNQKYLDHDKNVELLNDNIKGILNPLTNEKMHQGVLQKFKRCLDAPNYTVFSNTTSEADYNSHSKNPCAVSLEDPHNYLHLAIGGFFNREADDPGDLQRIALAKTQEKYPFDPIVGATGDMGENEYASFDPIFYFHHCNIDRIFWLWQIRNDQKDRLEIDPRYKGTNSSDGQGPAAEFEPNKPLTLESRLEPFDYASKDVINIETQLGYRYTEGSLAEMGIEKKKKEEPVYKLIVSGINRAVYHGSFMVRAFMADSRGTRTLLGVKPFLSRWNVSECANCQNHLEGVAVFDLPYDISSKVSVFLVEIDSRPDEEHPEEPPEVRYFAKDTRKVEANIEIDWHRSTELIAQKAGTRQLRRRELTENISELNDSRETEPDRISNLQARSQARGMSRSSQYTPLDGYEFVQGMDSEGNDINDIGNRVTNLEVLKEQCDNDTNCVGFNTNGCLKREFKPINLWTRFSNDPRKGTYVKKQI